MKLDATTVAFPSREGAAFMRDIKAGVATYFETSGRSSKGGWAMWLKTFALFTVLAASYAAILSNRFPPLAMLGFALVMGIAVAGIVIRRVTRRLARCLLEPPCGQLPVGAKLRPHRCQQLHLENYSVHYRAISRFVREAAATHGIPCLEQPTLAKAIRSHYRMLKHFGRQAGSAQSALAACGSPVVLKAQARRDGPTA